jgi:hypothetical protein
MGIFRKKPQSPAKQARKQIKELGSAVQQTVKKLDRSYPSLDKTSRIEREFAHKLASATKPHPLVAELRKCEAELAYLTNKPQSWQTFRDSDRIRVLYSRIATLEEKLGIVHPPPAFVKELAQCSALIRLAQREPLERRSVKDQQELEALYNRKAELEEHIRDYLRREAKRLAGGT